MLFFCIFLYKLVAAPVGASRNKRKLLSSGVAATIEGAESPAAAAI